MFLLSLALFRPGIATYDTVAQYGQVLSGEVDDWHPPVMVWLWSRLAPAAPGAMPMLVVQLALYWLGLGLLAARVGRRGWVVLAIGASPLLLGWQGVVLKDAQMVGALAAAVGVIGWWRLRGRRVPLAAVAIVALLLGYAALVRANAVFAVVPLAAMLLPLGVGGWRRLALAVAGIAAVLIISPAINHDLLGAGRSGVERTQAVYDLAAIAVRAGPGATPLDAAAVDMLRTRHCVKPFFWDPLGDPAHCAAAVAPLQAMPVDRLYLALADAALAHPVAYAAHRLAHLNSTERWLVADRWPSVIPPAVSEANGLGLRSPGSAAVWWQGFAALFTETPLGWPITWVAAALMLWPMAGTDAGGRLARALIVSALSLEASFAVLSIASDLRYHLWPMLVVALAGVLVRWRPLPRASRVMAAALLAVVFAGTVARLALPVPPQTYRALLG